MLKQSLDYVARYKHGYVGIEHLLLALTALDSVAAVTKRNELKSGCEMIRKLTLAQIQPGDGDGSRSVPQTPSAKQVIIDAMEIAGSLGQFGVNPEHLFLALLGLDSAPLIQRIVTHEQFDLANFRNGLTLASREDNYRLPPFPEFDG